MRQFIAVVTAILLVCLPILSNAEDKKTTDTAQPAPVSSENATASKDGAKESTEESKKPEFTASDHALKKFILSKNSALKEEAALNMVKSINKASATYDVDRKLITAVIWIESNFDPNTISGKCIGLMQIHVNTGKSLGLSRADLFNSDLSIKHGTKYLSQHIKNYNGDILKGLSAYNQGSTRVNSGNYSTWYQEKVSERWKKVEKFIEETINQ